MYYRQHDVPVVYLVGPDGVGAHVGDADVRTLPRGVEFDQIADAVFDLALTKVGTSRTEAVS